MEHRSIFEHNLEGHQRQLLLERMQVELAMILTGGCKAKAAKFWGWSVKTLYNKLERYPALKKRWIYEGAVREEEIVKVAKDIDDIFDISVMTPSDVFAKEHLRRTKDSYWWKHEANNQDKLDCIKRIRSLY